MLSFDAATTAATPSRLLKNRLLQRNRPVWDASELDQAERWERNKIVVDGAGRRKYIALAREELFKESGNA